MRDHILLTERVTYTQILDQAQYFDVQENGALAAQLSAQDGGEKAKKFRRNAYRYTKALIDRIKELEDANAILGGRT